MSEVPQDTGDLLEVPVKDRLEEDDFVLEEVNEDEHRTDFTDVPDGNVVTLSTAYLDDDEEED